MFHQDDRYYIRKMLWKLHEILIAKYLPHTSQVLVDFGAGSSPYYSLYKSKVIKYLKADIDSSNNADIIISPLGRLPIEDNSVDIVLSTQVLEHVEDYMEYLNEIKRVLKKNGLVILTTHGYWMYHPHPNDYWRWTADGLNKIFSDLDFDVKDIAGILNLRASGLQLFQDGISYKIPRFIRPLFILVAQFLIKIMDNGSINNKDAAVYAVVALKK